MKHQISRSHSKSFRFWPKSGVSGLYLLFEITDGYEMMHKAWKIIEEVPYCFSRSSVKFQGHTALKIIKFDPNCAFPDCNSSLNSPMATSRSYVKFQGHMAFPDCNSSLKSPMARKWCTKLEVALKRCPIVFQGHTSICKVTQLKELSNLTQIGRFRTVSPVWNSLMDMKWYTKLDVV